MSALPAPSPRWSREWPRLEAAARLGPMLDVACGRGRHALAVAARGVPVLGIDRSAEALRELTRRGAEQAGTPWTVRADLEAGHGLPCPASRFGAVLVFRYLHRALAPALADALRPGGLLLYETFTIRQRDLGHGPENPAFLLRPGELPTLFPGLEIVSFEETLHEGARPEWLATLVARRPAP